MKVKEINPKDSSFPGVMSLIIGLLIGATLGFVFFPEIISTKYFLFLFVLIVSGFLIFYLFIDRGIDGLLSELADVFKK